MAFESQGGYLDVLPRLEDARGVGGEAVDAPVGVAVRVADGDGEAAEVGASHFDGDVTGVLIVVVAAAVEGHGVALAAVVRLVTGAVGGQAWKREAVNVLSSVLS